MSKNFENLDEPPVNVDSKDPTAAASADIWILLERSPAPAAVTPQVNAPKPPPTPGQRFRKGVWWTCLNGLSIIVWGYVICTLFAFNVDSVVVRMLGGYSGQLISFKILFVPVILLAVSLFFWKWKTLGATTYLALFPLIVVLWHLPRLFYKTELYRNLIVCVAMINAAVSACYGARYHLITKSIALLSVAALLLSHNPYVLISSALSLVVVFLWGIVRAVIHSFRADFFIRSQRTLIGLVAKSTEAPLTFAELQGKVTMLSAEQRTAVTNKIQNAVLLNRALYLWAYTLQKYRESNAGGLFSALSYVTLLFSAVIVFFLLNFALLKIDPHQFTFETLPSIPAVLLYALCTLALGEGGRISAVGDWAYVLRIFAGLFGPVFLVTALVNVLFVFRSSRVDTDLRATVEELRRRARKHEAHIEQVLSVGIEEACERLVRLGIVGLSGAMNWMTKAVPEEFFSD